MSFLFVNVAAFDIFNAFAAHVQVKPQIVILG